MTEDLAGRIFTRLKVLYHVGAPGWKCQCVCGKEVNATRCDLLRGRAKSCGCYRIDKLREQATTHALSKIPEYRIWAGMIERCCRTTNPSYRHYGGRGICIYEGWRNDFKAFFECLGPRPSPRHSLDRYPNNNGNYEPGNVRWATPEQQGRNKRNNVVFQIDGQSMTAEEVSSRLGFSRSTSLLYRLRNGWSVEDAITIPKGGSRASYVQASV